MKLGAFSLSLNVSDIEASRAFYEKLGAKLEVVLPDYHGLTGFYRELALRFAGGLLRCLRILSLAHGLVGFVHRTQRAVEAAIEPKPSLPATDVADHAPIVLEASPSPKRSPIRYSTAFTSWLVTFSISFTS